MRFVHFEAFPDDRKNSHIVGIVPDQVVSVTHYGKETARISLANQTFIVVQGRGYDVEQRLMNGDPPDPASLPGLV